MSTATHLPRRVGIIGAGHTVPDRVVTTSELQANVESESGFALPPGVFEQVTGIRSRHVVGPGEYASTLAVEAARRALTSAERDPAEVDLLIFASASRDFIEPATAHVVQHELGTRAHCFDVTNACNSFLNGVDLAGTMIATGRARTALVVTGETPSLSARMHLADPQEAISAFAGYTFGDAGGAVVLERVTRGGLQHVETETHSEHWEVGGIFGGGSRHPRELDQLYFTGAGRGLKDVFEKIGPAIVDSTLARCDLGWTDVSKVLVHQVTRPYLDRFVEITGAPTDKLDVTIEDHGNMASATLAVQLSRAWSDLSAGDRVLLVGLGGGVSVMTTVWERS